MSISNQPKAIVLGCTGQDGRIISKSLIHKGYRILGTSRNPNYENQSKRELERSNQFKVLKCDLLNYEKIKELIHYEKPDEIYNFAAQSSVGLSFKYPKETNESIEKITYNILNASREINYKGRLFFAGSSEMFGETKKPANANSSVNPISPYGESKLKSFLLVRKYRQQYGINCVTGIFFNHESKIRSKTFVTQKIIQAAKEIVKGHMKILQLGNIEIIRDWGLADEYMEASQKIIKNKILKDYTICTGQSVSLKYFIDAVFTQLGLQWQNHIEINKDLFRPNDIKQSFGDPNDLYKDLNWKAQINIDQLIVHLLDK